ncbi:TetR family transcriptional regulator [Xenorhabdus sp. 12]|uniref:TetR family transcriptional regulator n=1 Tax=Xenorhabdus santafensis TaxID=2582833 RepID=A0ABU4S7D3_9GAMM|nr:TetR/AcrR family transcriptional regulator [Xenorhabdus sp. 12]MDX7985836.1 TetR family transcriptional regulator [Xenorhabdus sp. 12]
MSILEAKPRRGRPPKHPRDNLDTKNALIQSGIEMLTERGYMTSDIEGILKRVGVPKGSFYYYFDSKESFGREVIASYSCYFSYKLDKYLNNKSISPLERISSFYEDARDGMAKHKFERGCLIGNLGQEVTILPEGYRDILNQIINDWQSRIEGCLIEAQMIGEISKNTDCKKLASFFWIGWEGAVMRAKLMKDAEPLTIFIDGFISGLSR